MMDGGDRVEFGEVEVIRGPHPHLSCWRQGRARAAPSDVP
jgi:hypothetical protein